MRMAIKKKNASETHVRCTHTSCAAAILRYYYYYRYDIVICTYRTCRRNVIILKRGTRTAIITIIIIIIIASVPRPGPIVSLNCINRARPGFIATAIWATDLGELFMLLHTVRRRRWPGRRKYYFMLLRTFFFSSSSSSILLITRTRCSFTRAFLRTHPIHGGEWSTL